LTASEFLSTLTDADREKIANEANYWIDYAEDIQKRADAAMLNGDSAALGQMLKGALNNFATLVGEKAAAEAWGIEVEHERDALRAALSGSITDDFQDEVTKCLGDIEALEKQAVKVIGSNIFLRSWRAWAQSEVERVAAERDSLRQTLLDLRPKE
jgi:hypothetical protein